ncbi:MAG TPA: PAS domain-containing sensor histidine kinase, partial [Thermodesulfovibrionales bacterium]|nr:PAS domain-containing sensor histidine kinase [Thermodesulfovibrionales bacterium]
RLLKKELRENRFQKQSLEKHIEEGRRLIGDTILRMRSIQKELQRVREEAERQKFDTVIQKMGDGVVVCTADWKIAAINSSAQKYLNITELEKINLIDFILKNYSVSISKEEMIDVSRSHKTFDVIRQETEQFKALYFEASLDVLKDTQEKVSNIIVTIRDVTDARTEELMKQDFLSLMSHKLRTPLNVITQSASIIQKENICGSLNDKQKKYIESVLRQSRLLTNLIDELLKFTELNTMKLDLQKEEIMLCDYLPLLVDPMIEGIKDKKIELKIDCSDKCYMIRINKSHMNMIMRNLVENAIKFNDKEVIKINISVKKSAQELQISIYDNGRGIPAEDQGKIFEKFYQIEKFFTGNVEGAGLGLALVKRLVSAYGGQIDLESEIGKGATFTVTFPA